MALWATERELDRRPSITVAQLRVSCSPLTGDTRFRLGPAESDEKVRCDEPDSAKHLLVDYPAYQGPRTRPWGPLPTLREILSTEAGLIRDFLVETGQVTRDDMLKKKKKKHRPEDATESVFSEDESESLPVSASSSTPTASQNRAVFSLVSVAMLDLIH